MRPVCQCVVCAVMWLLWATNPALAVDRSWINSAGGVYNVSGNWNTGVPQAADNGIFNLSSAGYTVTFNAGTTSGGMIVRNDVVTMNLSGFTLTLSSASPGLSIADQASNLGRLTIQNGTISTNSVTLAGNASATGVATITTGGRLTVNTGLNVGSAGLGSLNVFSGGRLVTASNVLGFNAGSSGSITVSGAGSSWTSSFISTIGNSGNGTVRVISGGTASLQSLILGSSPGSSGQIFVDGIGSALTFAGGIGGAHIGSNGSGSLSISNNAVVNGTDLTLGSSPTGSGFVSVASGGSLNCSGFVDVAQNGSGSVDIATGGRAVSGSLNLALLDPASTATVTITGNTSSWTVNGNTTVGGEGSGTMNVNFATFTTNNATLGNSTLSSGRLIVEGSASFTANNLLTVGRFGQGIATVSTGADLSCGSMTIGQFGGGSGSLVVRDPGSTVVATNEIIVGSSGIGTATVDTTADVSCATLTLGRFSSGSGNINISGTGSTWSATALTVGASGAGSVQVTSGGALTSTTAQIGAELGSAGAVLVSGNTARWTSSGNVFVGGGSISAGGSGSLEIGPGGNVQANSLLRLYPTGEIHLNGGSLSVGTMDNQGGQFNFNSGNLNFTSPVAGLTIDQFGPLGGILELRDNQTLGVNATLTIGFNGQLTIDGGRVIAAALNNTSDVVLESATSHLTATVFNTGQLHGEGLIFGNVNNNTNGQIRASSGETLRVIGALTNNSGARIDLPGGILQPGALENSGQVFLDGGVLDVGSSLVNQSTGRISGRGRIIATGNVNNSGSFNLSSGITDIEAAGGIFNNNASGKVIVTGNSTTNFFLPVTNAAGSEMRVSTGATAVCFEPVSGLSAFTGSGTVIFESTASLGSINRIGTTVVGASGALTAGHVRENLLEVNGQATVLPNGTTVGTSRVQQLVIAGELEPVAQLDLSDNDLVIDYTGPSPLLTIAAQLRAGYASGSWTGNGIRSSAAASNPNFALGFAEASEIFTSFPAIFSGQTIDSTALLIAYTRYGDANLDGIVNLSDFNRLAANFGAAGGWFDGDFNYDGIVNLSDFNRLAANFGLIASPDGPTPQDWANLASVVPEPAAAALLLVALGLPLRRRRAFICRS